MILNRTYRMLQHYFISVASKKYKTLTNAKVTIKSMEISEEIKWRNEEDCFT